MTAVSPSFEHSHHDHRRCAADALRHAEIISSREGLRLTEQRRRVLEALLESHVPASAYDVIDRLAEKDRAAEAAAAARGEGRSATGKGGSGAAGSGEPRPGEARSAEATSGKARPGEGRSGAATSAAATWGEARSGAGRSGGESSGGASSSGASSSGAKSGEARSGGAGSGGSKPARRLAPISVYRALDFLTEHRFAHRIESKNAYVACDRGEDCAADATLFLICDNCGAAGEAPSESLATLINTETKAAGFLPRLRVLEVRGLCATCKAG
jgi:Fe2+ or Zn2+ uptake regulation protein